MIPASSSQLARRRRAARLGCGFRLFVFVALAGIAVTGVLDHRFGGAGRWLAGWRRRAVAAYPPLGRFVVRRSDSGQQPAPAPPLPPIMPGDNTPPPDSVADDSANDSAPAVPAVIAPDEEPAAPVPAGTTLIEASADRPVVTVYVNDQPVEALREPNGRVDVAPLVRPGPNTLRVAWSAPVTYASVVVRHGSGVNDTDKDEKNGLGLYEGGGPRDAVADLYLAGRDTARPGEIRTQFWVPDPADPASPQTVAATGERAGAVLLDAGAPGSRAPVTVFINNKNLGDFQTRRALDVSQTLGRSGAANAPQTLRVAWRAPVGYAEVRVLHRLRPGSPPAVLAQIRLGPDNAARPGQVSATFRLPGPADPAP